jgi:DNA-binding transcriptional regulator YiaG
MAEDGAQEEKKQAPHYPNRLHEIRDALGVKHASELARKIGIPAGTYQSWENGSRQLELAEAVRHRSPIPSESLGSAAAPL